MIRYILILNVSLNCAALNIVFVALFHEDPQYERSLIFKSVHVICYWKQALNFDGMIRSTSTSLFSSLEILLNIGSLFVLQKCVNDCCTFDLQLFEINLVLTYEITATVFLVRH